MDSLLYRISELARLEGITIGALEKKIGASKGVLSRAIHNNTDIQSKWLTKIVENYPSYSADWLLSGKGNKVNGTVQTYDLKAEEKRTMREVPVYDMEATAGFKSIYDDYSRTAEEYLSIPNLPPVDGALYARGDSMSPLIDSGDIVIFQRVQNKSNIIWGHIYIITYFLEGDEYTVLKYIRRSSIENHIRLESFNPKYDPFDIPLYAIVALGLVKASISFHTIG